MQQSGYQMSSTLALSTANPDGAFPSENLRFDALIKNFDVRIPLKMVAASICIPKDDPKYPRGDDAHFVAGEHQAIGVADGVGGWRKSGIDGGEYARQLMHNSLVSLRTKADPVDPKTVLEEAYQRTNVPGSSTACIVALSGDGVLRAANVGDSGFVVVRGGLAVYRSPIQQRSFNCPYQLGTTKDGPSTAEEIEIRVEKGDVVVVGTDGLFDNVHAREMAEVVGRRTPDGGDDLAEQCCYLANLALYNSFDRYGETPYSAAAGKAGKRRRGGKVDDITVVIARVD